MIKKPCPKCGKLIQKRSKLCNSCHNRIKALKLWKGKEYREKQLKSLLKHRPPMGKGSRKHRKCKHHIDLNKYNNNDTNTLILTNSNHEKLHKWAYRYLLENNMIKSYMKWFFRKVRNANGDI